jgi:hypothetical protein
MDVSLIIIIIIIISLTLTTVAQANLKLSNLLPQTLKYWDYRLIFLILKV